MKTDSYFRKKSQRSYPTVFTGMISILILLFSINGYAEEGKHVPIPLMEKQAGISDISMTEAVFLALENNHALRATQNGHIAAKWAHRQAWTQLFPAISLESNYTRLDDETVSRANALGNEITMYFPDSTGTLQPVTIEIPQSVFRNGYETSISGRLLLLNPAVWNGVSLAGASKDLAAGEVQTAIRSTVHQTLRSFVALLRLQSLVRLQEEHVDQAVRNTEQAERLFRVGKYSEADVLRWRVEEAQQSGILTETRQGLKVSALTLENLIGVDPTASISPDSVLPDAIRREMSRYRSMNEDAWEEFLAHPLMDVVELNPQLTVMEQSKRLAKLQHRQSLTAFMPSLTVAGSYGWQNNDTPDLDGDKTWAVSATVSLPLFTSFSNYSGYQTTKFQMKQTAETVEDARRSLLLGAEAARTAIRTAVSQLRLAETSLESARRGFEIQENAFKLGRLSNLEWIDANLALRSAEQSHTTSYYDLVLAIIDYYEFTGEILSLLEA